MNMFDITDIYLDTNAIGQLYGGNTVQVDDLPELGINTFVLASDGTTKALARVVGRNKLAPLSTYKDVQITGISPRDALQRAFVETLLNKEILISVAFGQAGTGKTSLAVAYALEMMHTENKRIVLSKPTTQVGKGKAFGAVPGDIGEKYAPYITSYNMAFQRLLGERSAGYLHTALQRKKIEFVPIEMTRGCEWQNATFILDEAQNTTWHEIKTLVSRMGQGSKLILLGDLRQIDIEELEPEDTGLYKLTHSKAWASSSIAASFELTKQYRSPVAQLVSDIDDELGTWKKKKKLIT